MIITGSGRIGGAGSCPTIGARVISAAGVERIASIPTAPDDHLTTGPDRRVIYRALGALLMLVAAQLSVPGLYLPPEQTFKFIPTAPDDHFTTVPDCRVKDPANRRGGCVGCRPGISSRIVFSAGVYTEPVISAPNDHFTAGPYCRVTASRSGRVDGADGCPTIRAGIISPAGI